MANKMHVAILNKGVKAWNAWRKKNPTVKPDLRRMDLSRRDLRGADLSGADLEHAHLEETKLGYRYVPRAMVRGVLSAMPANLAGVDLPHADLRSADLTNVDLSGSVLVNAFMHKARLQKSILEDTDLTEAVLSDAALDGANLSRAKLIGVNLSGATLNGARIYGIAAWGLTLEGVKQQNLVITHKDEPAITVDNIEVGQFIYVMLNNQKIRDVIDTITSKTVLILGRFTDERKAVLDALREELRKRNYVPILFDFNVPATRDITETVSLLARMARFIIADLTDPSSIPKELEAIIPGLAVPVQPLLEGASQPYAMFRDYWKYEWVLPVYRYEGLQPLLAALAEKVIAPAEGKVKALEERRRMIETELTKPQ
jgi:hypothetical protein